MFCWCTRKINVLWVVAFWGCVCVVCSEMIKCGLFYFVVQRIGKAEEMRDMFGDILPQEEPTSTNCFLHTKNRMHTCTVCYIIHIWCWERCLITQFAREPNDEYHVGDSRPQSPKLTPVERIVVLLKLRSSLYHIVVVV